MHGFVGTTCLFTLYLKISERNMVTKQTFGVASHLPFEASPNIWLADRPLVLRTVFTKANVQPIILC